jgi:hypothetical protein
MKETGGECLVFDREHYCRWLVGYCTKQAAWYRKQAGRRPWVAAEMERLARREEDLAAKFSCVLDNLLGAND